MPESLVLVVGADLCFRGLVRTLLNERLGLATAVAQDVAETVARVREAKPALVVLDVAGPSEREIKLLGALKTTLDAAGVPLLAMVPQRGPLPANSISTACASWVAKPLRIDSFLAAVRQCLPVLADDGKAAVQRKKPFRPRRVLLH